MSESVVKARVGAGGRIVIPSDMRSAMGLNIGDEVIIKADDEGLRLQTVRQAIAEAQKIVAKYVKPGRSLSKELIAERRKEAARERNRT
jgi:AbrB family looped-hinge helix DNA binding protein